MFGVFMCSFSLLMANLGVEYFRPTPDYLNACYIAWQQFVAIGIYYCLWVPNEV